MTLKIKFEQDSFTAGNERYNIFKRQILEPNRFDFVCGFTDGAKWYKDKQDALAIEFSLWKEDNAVSDGNGLYYGESRIGVSRENPVDIYQLLEIYKEQKKL